MDDIFEAIGDAIHDYFVDVCGGMFIGIFDDANAAVTDLHSMLMQIGAYSIILCLSLFKTSSISKSIFNAH